MTYLGPNRILKQYQAIEAQTGMEGANPHRLIQFLLEGALEHLAIAKGHMERRTIPAKGLHISRAIAIVDALRGSLDHDKGGELAVNLAMLYDYMERQLLQANRQNSAALLDEVAQLIIEIKKGWDAIPESLHHTNAERS